MKKIYYAALLVILMSNFSFSQSWTQKSSMFNYGRFSAIGCEANGKGYVGLGQMANGNYLDDFWEYDPITNRWAGKPAFPGGGRYGAAAYSIKGKVYVCFGFDNSHTCRNDIWEYNPENSTWTEKAPFPGRERYSAKGFVIGDSILYIGTGSYGSAIDYLYDFWKYNPSTDTWTQTSNFPGYNRSLAASFSLNGFGYLGAGFSDTYTATHDFWKFDPVTETWSAIKDLPADRSVLVNFTIGGKAYVGGGCTSYPYVNSNDFFEYDPVADTWTQTELPDGTIPRRYAVGFSIDDVGYYGAGYSEEGLFTDFWAFNDLISGTMKIAAVAELKIYPNPANDILIVEKGKGVNPQNTSASIYDIKGQLVLNVPISRVKTEINIHQLDRGTYIVKIKQKDNIWVERFVKE